jgi:hypothetical protein
VRITLFKLQLTRLLPTLIQFGAYPVENLWAHAVLQGTNVSIRMNPLAMLVAVYSKALERNALRLIVLIHTVRAALMVHVLITPNPNAQVLVVFMLATVVIARQQGVHLALAA